MNLEFAVTGCLVEIDGKFLFVEESKPGREGLFNMPSGHVENDETLEAATIRETYEESGYEVELIGLLGIYQSIRPTLNVSGPVFVGKITGGKATPSKDHPSVVWLTQQEVEKLDAENKLFTKYPPIAINDYLTRGPVPMDIISSVDYR